MPSLRKPSDADIRDFREAQSRLDFTYAAVGGTAAELPAAFVVDRTRQKLGTGENVFRAAIAAFQRWEQYRLGWTKVYPPEGAIHTGMVVVVLARVVGLWWLNACRVIYTVDEPGPPRRFGFAYGTLPGHAESGEERFLIEWDASDNSVWYDILAFSRPRHPLARLGYPLVRLTQRRFARQSAAAMLRAVESY